MTAFTETQKELLTHAARLLTWETDGGWFITTNAVERRAANGLVNDGMLQSKFDLSAPPQLVFRLNSSTVVRALIDG